MPAGHEGTAEGRSRYVVEIRPSRLGYTDMAALGRAADAAAQVAPPAAGPVRFLRVVSLPEDGTCLLLFEAGDEAAVAAVARDAFVDFERLAAVLDVPADGVGGSGAPTGPGPRSEGTNEP